MNRRGYSGNVQHNAHYRRLWETPPIGRKGCVKATPLAGSGPRPRLLECTTVLASQRMWTGPYLKAGMLTGRPTRMKNLANACARCSR